MTQAVPRVRMFAGPNGSGKSTINAEIRTDLFGTYVNPDLIESELKKNGRLNVDQFEVELSTGEIYQAVNSSSLFSRLVADGEVFEITVSDGELEISPNAVNSYMASILAGLIRRELLKSRASFSFETVMSSEDKIDFLKQARSAGYRTYLYYVATEDPLINISRVRNRVLAGGHDVPEEKIVSRYHRTLSLLWDAVKCSDRAYIFDNSGKSYFWLAEIIEGRTIEFKSRLVPQWFKTSVLDRISSVS